MDVSSHHEGGGEIPIPINTSYGHIIHHDHPSAAAVVPHNHHILSSSAAAPQIPAITNINNNGHSSITTAGIDHHHHDPPPPHVPYVNKKMVRYRECLKNHAAAMGGNATDGCGEFMPSGEEGSIEALTCSACNCHRNFHRKEIEGETPSSSCDLCSYHSNNPPHRVNGSRKVILSHGHHKSILSGPEAFGGYPMAGGALMAPSSRAGPHQQQHHLHHHHQMIMSTSYNNNIMGGGGGSLPSESDEQEDVGGGVVMPSCRPPHLTKKRFRTKFTQEQKEKMLNFADKVGWKIQKQEEAVVQQFCQDIGVKRRVLKVWMHNNKHSLAKKIHNPTTTTTSIN
ncbi:hypothetical protein Tsubulata_010311 [Turnera subulata]|uniref:ZF-HD dimerization-type domain-containing protein n=1 Tax=Turnera subulata TaxID=218843 RepID=A0A9Q0JNC6_9ROSI|nr:hypothetical protein Tsubulata_010311 [Turnera subulata]